MCDDSSKLKWLLSRDKASESESDMCTSMVARMVRDSALWRIENETYCKFFEHCFDTCSSCVQNVRTNKFAVMFEFLLAGTTRSVRILRSAPSVGVGDLSLTLLFSEACMIGFSLSNNESRPVAEVEFPTHRDSYLGPEITLYSTKSCYSEMMYKCTQQSNTNINNMFDVIMLSHVVWIYLFHSHNTSHIFETYIPDS